MKDFFKRKGWRICFGAYIFIYLPWFMILERIFSSDYPRLHIINIPFDNMIPFCEYFIIPYVLWYLYVVGGWKSLKQIIWGIRPFLPKEH